ncbi:MAG: hypothetical protein HQM13_14040 [SAR324 cluster bacterium]|nr:hypothetical protein [SAR324 cluster bacterium]
MEAATQNSETQEFEVPEDYAEQLAGRIIVLHEKELDPSVSSENIARLIFESTKEPSLLKYFIDATEILVDDPASSKFAAVSWAALSMQSDVVNEYVDFMHDIVNHILEAYYSMSKPEVDLEGKKFSAHAHILASVYIRMIEINQGLYETIQEIYSSIIRAEMELDDNAAEKKEKEKAQMFMKKGAQKQTVSKKLYDDIIDFLSARGDFKSTSLNQENPNEHIAVLADRMRGTRRYVIQDIMNKRALERKKRLEKELSERLASAEEVILASNPFRDGLALFWREKRYNYKFLAVEKIRVALQIIGIILGVGYFMAGYLGLWGIGNIDGILVCLGMWGFSKFAGSRKNFKSFYPYDVSKELENNVNNFTNVMRRMSKDQLDQFLTRQIKTKVNESVVQLIPEYIKYLYAVMPDRKNMVLTVDELSDLMENIEVDIAKQLRARL